MIRIRRPTPFLPALPPAPVSRSRSSTASRFGKPFLFAGIGGAVGGGFAAALHLKSFAMGGPSFLSFGMFTGGENPFLNCALVMAGFVIAFIVAAVLTVLFWNPDEKKKA